MHRYSSKGSAPALTTDTELRRDYEIFRRMKADLNDMGSGMRTQGTIWDTVNRRLTRPAGWILFVVGLSVWVAYASFAFVTGPEAIWEKLAVGAVVIGAGMLFLSVVIDRLRDLRTDPYREIER